jgi:hypothetical protein
MKILIIDSHKSNLKSIPQNMHWQNSKILSDYLGADLIWSYPNVNDDIKSNYDIIIFVHASHYSYTDYQWIEKSPNAKLFYISNEYNLGEPRTLWMSAKTGRKYNVIANHSHIASKIVMKYVDNWHILNINSLIYDPKKEKENYNIFDFERKECIYYGSFRKDRSVYFKKYLNQNILLSTHSKNINKFMGIGVTSVIQNRIDWSKEGLLPYKYSLYMEDEKTHTHYNFLANRFYEALNYNCIPIFTKECEKTVELSGYNISDEYFISDSSEIKNKKNLLCKSDWYNIASKEKEETLSKLLKIIKNT